MLVRLNWVQQGQIMWNSNWVERYGETRSHVPGLDDHISFANHDLQRNGFPRIEKHPNGNLVVDIADASRVPVVAEIIGYHGFKIDS